MHIPTVLLTALSFLVLLGLKTALDFHLAPRLVRWLSGLPSRGIFRFKWTNLRGEWDVLWGAGGSSDFQDESRRKAKLTIWQFGPYCYGEFVTGGSSYAMFSRIRENYLVGDWYATEDSHGYFGALQLFLRSERRLEGKWIGHSKSVVDVRADLFEVTRRDR